MRETYQNSCIWDLVPRDYIIEVDKPVEKEYWIARENDAILLAIEEINDKDKGVIMAVFYGEKTFICDIVDPILEKLKPEILKRIAKIEKLKAEIEDIINESSL